MGGRDRFSSLEVLINFTLCFVVSSCCLNLRPKVSLASGPCPFPANQALNTWCSSLAKMQALGSGVSHSFQKPRIRSASARHASVSASIRSVGFRRCPPQAWYRIDPSTAQVTIASCWSLWFRLIRLLSVESPGRSLVPGLSSCSGLRNVYGNQQGEPAPRSPVGLVDDRDVVRRGEQRVRCLEHEVVLPNEPRSDRAHTDDLLDQP